MYAEKIYFHFYSHPSSKRQDKNIEHSPLLTMVTVNAFLFKADFILIKVIQSVSGLGKVYIAQALVMTVLT